MILRSLRDLFFKVRYGFKGVPFKIGDKTIRLDESLRRWNIASESGVHQILADYLQPGDIFIDIGANFGLHSLYAAQLVGNKGHVFAFEPVPATLKLLKVNIELNDLYQQVTIVPKSLSNSPETSVTFYIPPEEVAVTAALQPYSENVQTIKVANVRLDDYWDTINMPVKLIKIDVEGAELEVLRGAEKLLAQCKPVLLIEVHGFALPNFNASVKDLRNFLREHGYQERLLEGEHCRGEEYFHALYSC
ncbi:MAG TPA: hypothetical protein DEG17_07890 [Cyanobacteria bacterium UBA11149]|nr:hypothetical protein [Cyanobacteria bacterium UBA11367]HBE60173.1 hypothetical protein [Cyanobacteria bacterium UBA11366]HBK64883.1 hypothetical protein [Cyanobacteria bacterium UBA11166]HBR75492.1 hypothetical protein [Cyanobacteria bacterium UBA11159]HBS70590.1 hypothetical protein [Cyanobacteria bacterium UBA11153]HBW88782.1 hypothetical protein [Cyanobacteria bacterium UBA11149]HCA98231.1 hypothetical protein [Cyanobacteria bacterium UBA9226]